MEVYVDFTDSDCSVVKSVFANAQDDTLFPNQGFLEDNDPRYLAFLDSLQPNALSVAVEERDRLLSLAALRIAPLQDAVDLDDASSDEVALLKKWKQYRIQLNRLDIEVAEIRWPSQP